MNKLYFIKNPEVFQGEKYLKTNKSYNASSYYINYNIDDFKFSEKPFYTSKRKNAKRYF